MQAKADARRIKSGENSGQYWFDPTKNGTINDQKRSAERENAEKIIRTLISEARHRVIIVDPYATGDEIFNFAVHVRNEGIEIGVLTTKSAFSGEDALITQAGNALASAQQVRPNLTLRVGSTAALHDRFIIIDDQVWRCGTSLNSIGTTIGGMDRAQDPEPYLTTLTQVWAASPTWEDWLKDSNR